MTRDRTLINNLLYEFKSVGFIESNKIKTVYQRCNLRTAGAKKFSITRKTPGSTKYNTPDLLGTIYFNYLYDSENPIKFIQFLYHLFHITNPDPSEGLRKAFTQVLSSNYLIPKNYYDNIRYR